MRVVVLVITVDEHTAYFNTVHFCQITTRVQNEIEIRKIVYRLFRQQFDRAHFITRISITRFSVYSQYFAGIEYLNSIPCPHIIYRIVKRYVISDVRYTVRCTQKSNRDDS